MRNYIVLRYQRRVMPKKQEKMTAYRALLDIYHTWRLTYHWGKLSEKTKTEAVKLFRNDGQKN